MKKEIALVVMAAGMGSRFGGLKQIEEIGFDKEFLIDYSIYDARLAGFTKVVFIIRRENYDIFRETIGKRLEDKMKVEYVFQELTNIPEGFKLPEREKPLGTAHAILCCQKKIKTPFAIINADDFYGRDAYKKAIEFLKNKRIDSNEYGMIAYKLGNTMTGNKKVRRGICNIQDGYLTEIVESSVQKEGNNFLATLLDGKKTWKVDKDETVSMNLFLLTPTIFKHMEENFPIFLEEHSTSLDTCEYFLPTLLNQLLKEEKIKIKGLQTKDDWYGMTYHEDLDIVKNAIKEFVSKKVYPKSLWK